MAAAFLIWKVYFFNLILIYKNCVQIHMILLLTVSGKLQDESKQLTFYFLYMFSLIYVFRMKEKNPPSFCVHEYKNEWSNFSVSLSEVEI